MQVNQPLTMTAAAIGWSLFALFQAIISHHFGCLSGRLFIDIAIYCQIQRTLWVNARRITQSDAAR